MTGLFIPILTALMTVVAVIISYTLSVRAYFRQKEHEETRRRYLDEGIDALAAQVERALQVFRHNWSNALTVLKHFRDLKALTDKNICNGRFIELDPSTFQIIPSYRVNTLIGDPEKPVWVVQQSLFAFVKMATDFFVSDMCSFIKVALDCNGELPPDSPNTVDEYIDIYMRGIKERDGQANRFYLLLEELEKISEEFGKIKRLNQNKIAAFRNNENVRASSERLKTEFSDKI